MNNKEIYNELQLINEFEANFRPTTKSDERKQELLLTLLDNLYAEHDMLHDNDRLVQAFDCMREIRNVEKQLN